MARRRRCCGGRFSHPFPYREVRKTMGRRGGSWRRRERGKEG
jgi:hypothetical protein